MKVDIKQLKTLLDEDNLTITQFAAEAGLHPQTVYNALWGKALRKQSVGKLCEATQRLKLKRFSKATA